MNKFIKLKIIKIKYHGDFKVYIEFDDGLAGVADLENHLWGEVFLPLKDKEYFSKCFLHPETETIAWDNDVDLAPEFLRKLVEEQNK